MWYPNISLTRGFRLAIMISLITSFFIVSPIIILYTAGYRYDTKTHHIKETGVITVDPTPQDATITLNGVVINKRPPIRLPNRAPGLYDLNISRPGYLPSSMTLEVQSKQTTYVNDIVLYRDVLPTLEYQTPEDAIRTAISSNGRFVIHTLEKNDGVYEVLLHDLTLQDETIVWRGQADHIPDIAWSPYAPVASITIARPTGIQIEKFNALRPTAGTSYELSTTSSPKTAWSQLRPDALYVEQDGYIDVLLEDTSYVLGNLYGAMWFVDANQTIWSIDKSGAVRSGKTLIHTFQFSHDPIAILDVTSTHILIQTSQGIAILWLDSGNVVTMPGTHAIQKQFSDINTPASWIVWSPFEVYEIDGTGSYTLITRTNTPLISVQYLSVYSAFLFVYDTSIVAYHPLYRTSHVLFETTHAIQDVSVGNTGKTLLFDTTVNTHEGIYARQL